MHVHFGKAVGTGCLKVRYLGTLRYGHGVGLCTASANSVWIVRVRYALIDPYLPRTFLPMVRIVEDGLCRMKFWTTTNFVYDYLFLPTVAF